MSDNQSALRQSLRGLRIDRDMLRYVLDQSRDCIKILGPHGHIEYINSEGRCALHVSNYSAMLGRHWPELWPEESRPTIEKALVDALRGESSEVEAHRPDPRGETTWWRISVSPLLEEDGELTGILTLSRDISSHVQLREAEQTLALELRHRLRNAYTIASAIVMQSASAPDNKAFAETVCSRLADVALSQTRLLEAGHKRWALSELVHTLVSAHGAGATGIRYAGNADATVDGQEALLIALVLGELTNNSVKYGALRRRKPVSLSWVLDDGRLTLHWREPVPLADGNGLEARDEGSGYSLMQRMARSQKARFSAAVEKGLLLVTLTVGAPRGSG